MKEENEYLLTEEPEVCPVKKDNRDIFKSLCFMQIGVLSVSVIWAFIRKIYFWDNIALDLNLVWGMAFAIIFSIFSFIMYVFRDKLSFMNYDWIMEKLYKPMFANLSIWQIIVISLLSGICEESLFRGVMLKEWGPIISSIVFGICHLGDKRLIASGIWIAFAGYLLTVLFYNTGNIASCMIAHCMNNFLSFLFVIHISKKRIRF